MQYARYDIMRPAAAVRVYLHMYTFTLEYQVQMFFRARRWQLVITRFCSSCTVVHLLHVRMCVCAFVHVLCSCSTRVLRPLSFCTC